MLKEGATGPVRHCVDVTRGKLVSEQDYYTIRPEDHLFIDKDDFPKAKKELGVSYASEGRERAGATRPSKARVRKVETRMSESLLIQYIRDPSSLEVKDLPRALGEIERLRAELWSALCAKVATTPGKIPSNEIGFLTVAEVAAKLKFFVMNRIRAIGVQVGLRRAHLVGLPNQAKVLVAAHLANPCHPVGPSD